MDGKLSTMYSSGSPETSADNPKTRAEFIAKIQKAKAAVQPGQTLKTIFSEAQPTQKIDSGNWQISCTENGVLTLTNREGNQQKLLIKEDMPGFIFESRKYNRQVFSTDSTLGKHYSLIFLYIRCIIF